MGKPKRKPPKRFHSCPCGCGRDVPEGSYCPDSRGLMNGWRLTDDWTTHDEDHDPQETSSDRYHGQTDRDDL